MGCEWLPRGIVLVVVVVVVVGVVAVAVVGVVVRIRTSPLPDVLSVLTEVPALSAPPLLPVSSPAHVVAAAAAAAAAAGAARFLVFISLLRVAIRRLAIVTRNVQV